ncbi:MAG: tyrosine-type recombinase/integrase [Fusobacteriaceae bacterium]
MLELKREVKSFLYFLELGEDRSHNSIRSIRSDLEQFCKFLENYKDECSLKEIDQFVVRSFINFLSKNMVGKRSVNRKISTLRTFYKHLQKREIVDKNPMLLVDFPEFEAEAPEFVTLKEIEKLRESIEVDTVNGLRDRAMFEVLYSSGITSQELLKLGESVINFDNREFKIYNGKVSRIVFFSERALEYLKRYIENKKIKYGEKYSKDILFVNGSGTRLSARSLRRIIDRYVEKGELKKEITPHMLRHTYALYLLAKGMEMKFVHELLGHSTLEFTKKYNEILKNFKSANNIE